MQTCKNCNTELTRDETRNCLRCLKCNPVNNAPPPPPKKGNVKVDEPWTDARIIKIVTPVIEEVCLRLIQEFYVPRTTDNAEAIVINGDEVIAPKWRDQAKELGIPLYDHELKKLRLKADVIIDIAAKVTEKSSVDDSDLSPVE